MVSLGSNVMRKFIFMILVFFACTISFAQNKILDKVVIVVGGKEPITLLEIEKRKEFFKAKMMIDATNTDLIMLDKEVINKIITEKMVYLIGTEKNIVIPDDDKLISSISDEKIKNEIRSNKLFFSDYVAEIKQQYILSRLITSDENLKKYLSNEPTDEEISEIVDYLYEKNKNNLKTVKVSFILITVELPQNLSLKEEKEIEGIFSEISNLIETKRYKQAIQLAENKLNKFLLKEGTIFVEIPTTIQSLAKGGIPLELLGPISGVKPGQVLPYPVKGLKIKGKDYAFALKVISREETNLSKEEFKTTLLLDPNLKQQIMAKIQDDRLKKWIINTFKSLGYEIKFLDKNYEVKI